MHQAVDCGCRCRRGQGGQGSGPGGAVHDLQVVRRLQRSCSVIALDGTAFCRMQLHPASLASRNTQPRLNPSIGLFGRYGGDFGIKRQLLEFLAAHLPPGVCGGQSFVAWQCHPDPCSAAPSCCNPRSGVAPAGVGSIRSAASLHSSSSCRTRGQWNRALSASIQALHCAGPAGELRQLLVDQGAEPVQLAFRPYDWSTNAAE